MTDSPPGHGTDPLGTIPLFNVNIPLTPARAAAIRHALTSLDTIRAQRRELDHREHQLITAAREAGATWQQIAATLGYKDRQAAQQRHRNLARTLASRPPSRTRTLRPDLRKHGKITFERQIRYRHKDNNTAERALRTPVIGRKNFYGSGAQWAAHLAADVWTITATAARHDTGPLSLLTSYLDACAHAGGTAPAGAGLDPFLPWTPQGRARRRPASDPGPGP